MSENHTPPGSPEEENLRRFLREAFGDALPEEALAGMDLSELAKQAQLPDDPSQLRAAAAQMQHLFSAGGEGPVNWTLARDIARQTATGTAQVPGLPAPSGSPGDPNPTQQQIVQLREAAHVAALWLEPVLAIDLPSQDLAVFSRGTWLARTLERWQSTVEPVAKYMATAIGEAIAAQMQHAPMPLPGDPAAMMEKVGGTMFGMQFGVAIGSLARESFGTTDLSLPLGRPGEPALVAANVEDLISEHGLEPSAARIFLAARELAHTALFTAAPWLGRTLFAAIEDYARGITLDLDALDEMVRGMDPSDLSSLQGRRPEEMFVFTRRASQERALEELATTLALVEAWVDHVTTQALTGKLPQLEAMREVLRRRRAAGSPAETMLADTVGIELRPRRVREALSWWDSVLATEGAGGREAKWGHPDLLPTAEILAGTPQAPRPDAAAGATGAGATGASAAAGAESAPSDGTDGAQRSASAEDDRSAGEPSLADIEFPQDFDAELAKLLAGEGDSDAPREDETGGLRTDDGAQDADDAPQGDAPEDPEEDGGAEGENPQGRR